MNSMLAQRIETLLEDYVATATHTATPLENNHQGFFQQYFSSIPYFEKHPDHCGFYPVHNDALNRTVPWALVKGGGEDTIVLIHHTDTVDTDDYGALKGLAHHPKELTRRLRAGALNLDEDAQRDLDSGDWVFGRGAADMKGGACVHMALLEEYASQGNFGGSLLMLGLPDEENLSAGMRSAVHLLHELRQRHGLNYVLMLNGEPQERTAPDLMRLYDGSVGKVMPIFFARGKVAHVGQIFKGFNPVHILSEIVTATELNPDFLEHVGNTRTPPPTWLFIKDRKEVYDVSLPISAAGYMSVLTLDRQVVDIMEHLKTLTEQAFEQALERANHSYRLYTKDPAARLPWQVNVKTYAEVYQQALADAGEALTEALAAYERDARGQIEAGSLSLAEAAFEIVEITVGHLRDWAPLVVLALAPPYYPHVNNTMLPAKAEDIQSLLTHLEDHAKKALGCDFHVQNYYTGISDLSYALFEHNQQNTDFITSNMLLWGDLYQIPFEEMHSLSIPVLNIGPWGKGFHKRTERVNLVDLKHRVPSMVRAAIDHMLQG